MYEMNRNMGKNLSVEDVVLIYLKENPEISVALDQGIINVSRLAKTITKSRTGLNPISVRAALNRAKERGIGPGQKEKADNLLRRSKISLQDKISVLKSSGPLQLKYISATFLENSVVYIIDEMIQKLPPSSDGVLVDSHVSMVHILSPKEIEVTPGFVMRITHKLFARGINILQLISCYNETILIIEKEKGISAYEILSTA
jgi:hypothetical protein